MRALDTVFLAAAATGARAATDNVMAGGAGRNAYFDWTRADVVALHWHDIPTDAMTWEAWGKVTDPAITFMEILAYSAYNVEGRGGEGGAVYEQANELMYGFTPTYVRLFRGTARYDCSEDECNFYEEEWIHQAFTWNFTSGEFGFFKNGEALDLGWTELILDGTSVSFSAQYGSELALGTSTLDVVTATDACDAGTYSAAAAGKAVVVELAAGRACADGDAYAEAVGEGAAAVVFLTTTALEESDSDAFDADAESAASIPVLLAADQSAPSSSVELFRSKKRYGTGDFVEPIEPSGVFTVGQEPDAMMSDFDELQAFNGFVDEVRVWATVRTDAEILDNYNRRLDDPTAEPDLHLAWYWDEDGGSAEGLLTDVTGNGQDALIGELPSITNEMVWATDRANAPPTAPRWYPSSAPVYGGDVVLAVRAGEDTTIALPAYDPDGDAITTKVATLPDAAAGTLRTYADASVAHAADDTVSDAERRVVFRAEADFAGGASFTYTVNDGGADVTATVVLDLFEVFEPEAHSEVIDEDTLSYIVLGRPGLDNEPYEVYIGDLPEHGQLYQAVFEEGSTETYLSLILDAVGDDHVAISAADALVDSNRGIVLYVPEADAYSDDEIYTSFTYYYVDAATGEQSAEATVDIYVTGVNDAPTPASGLTVSVPVGQTQASILLSSSDVDEDAPTHFAPKPFAKITSFPSRGELYQADGTWIDGSVERVPIVFAYVSNVLRHSSQYSLCANCFAFNNPECEYLTGACSDTAWMSEAIVGEPDFYPSYGDTKLGWDLSSENYGHEWIELEFPFEVYISAFELYETYKPGAVFEVSSAEEYTDDVTEYCDENGVENDAPVPCSADTEWTTLWTTSSPGSAGLKEEARIFSPPLCPATYATNKVRVDLDTSVDVTPGWNNYDAAKLYGSLEFPPGQVSDFDNEVIYEPVPGIFGDDLDSFEFTVTDCLDESAEAGVVSVSVALPTEDFTTPFTLQVATAAAGAAAAITVDFSDALAAAADAGSATADLTVHATAPASLSHDFSTVADIDASDADAGSVDVQLTPSGGTDTNALELWLEGDSGVTVAVQLVVCRLGWVYLGGDVAACQPCSAVDATTLSDADDSARFVSMCSVGSLTTDFERSGGLVAVPAFFAGLLLVLTLCCGVYTFVHRSSKVFRFAQVKFCFVILFGALLCGISVLLYVPDKTDGVCTTQLWVGHIAFALIMSALFAKTYRVHRLMNNKKLRKVVIKDSQLFAQVGAFTALIVVVLLLWTAVTPVEAQWTVSDSVEVIDHVEYQVRYQWCQSGDDPESPDRTFLGALMGIEGVFLLLGVYLSFMTRNTGDAVNESKGIAVCIYQTFFVGLVISSLSFGLELDPDISALLQGSGMCVVCITTVLVLFVPKIHAVHNKVNLELYATNTQSGTQGTVAGTTTMHGAGGGGGSGANSAATSQASAANAGANGADLTRQLRHERERADRANEEVQRLKKLLAEARSGTTTPTDGQEPTPIPTTAAAPAPAAAPTFQPEPAGSPGARLQLPPIAASPQSGHRPAEE